MNCEKVKGQIIEQLIEFKESTNCDKFFVNISGGIDSAVVGALCKLSGVETRALLLPCETTQDEIDRGKELCEKFNIDYDVIDLKPTFDTFVQNIGITIVDKKTLGNLKARLRANTAYFYANLYNGLVIGTDNFVEGYLGYFTVGGDGLASCQPISDLLKSEVFELGKYLGVPESILNAKPSAGLWKDQSDEDEMGMSYDEIEQAIELITDNCLFYPDEFNEYKIWDTLTDRQKEVINKVVDLHIKNSFKSELPTGFYIDKE